ncbi:MAG: tetraacyldisaccharide 4'-kinase [Deltaproteobacteria bacterium]|nr:MAG: tetraacyldisaccharide 4'-kinase [Deltaproteobacteria bacterium]
MDQLVNFHHRLVSPGAKSLPERFLLLLLYPFSYLYGVITWIRNRCYDFGWFSSYRSSLPVISVGNLAVGGTGKTPVVDWLVKEFQKRGHRPAIISRGFSGNYTDDVGIVSTGDGILMSAIECGDEPYLLARKNPDCPVLVAKKRRHAISQLEQSKQVDLIILDDAFQHRAVKRDVDLVLLDAAAPLGNGMPLPAGTLREFPGALKRADLLLMTRTTTQNHQHFMGFEAFESSHQLAVTATGLDGESISVSQLQCLRCFAFAGIADPQNFFSSLLKVGFNLKSQLSFADHVTYQGQTLNQINHAASGMDALITTEKDAVKLSADMFELPCYQIAMEIKINRSKEFFDHLTRCLWSK